MGGDNDSAVKMYMKSIECEENDREKSDHYREMARMYKDTDMFKFMEFSEKSIDICTMSGRLSAAASMTKECAQTLEENYEYEQAALWYEKCAKIYAMDNQTG